MTFHITYQGEPVLNGWTKRPASWPTREAAQAWIEYWSRNWPANAKHEITEHQREELQ